MKKVLGDRPPSVIEPHAAQSTQEEPKTSSIEEKGQEKGIKFCKLFTNWDGVVLSDSP